MVRTVMRVLLAAVGVALVVLGAGATVAVALANSTLTSAGAIRSAGQSIDVPGCATLIVELATAQVDPGRWGDVPLVEQRSVLTITPSGSSEVPWLVGAAGGQDIEQRLLGSRYCLAERMTSGWSVSSIAVADDDPDVRLDGVQGLWARVGDGQGAEFPVPLAGTTLVVTGDDASMLTAVEMVGEVRFEGGEQIAKIALFGGIGTAVLGLMMVVISIFALRRKGVHEGRSAQHIGVGLGGES